MAELSIDAIDELYEVFKEISHIDKICNISFAITAANE
jgi:hypothetical protein